MAEIALHAGASYYQNVYKFAHRVTFGQGVRLSQLSAELNGANTGARAVVWDTDGTVLATGAAVTVDGFTTAVSTFPSDVVVPAGAERLIGFEATGSDLDINSSTTVAYPHTHSAGGLSVTLLDGFTYALSGDPYPSRGPTTQDADMMFSVALSNESPNAPTLVTPVGGTTVNRNSAQRFDWDFSDPNPGDSQSKYDLRYRVVGTPTWTTLTEGTPNTFRDIEGGTFTEGDYEWQVRTYDAVGEVGPYSSSEFFTAATPPPGPTITSPASGATIPTASVTMEWSSAEQDSYEIEVLDSTGGTHVHLGPTALPFHRQVSIGNLSNGETYTFRVRVQFGGLWSAWGEVACLVSYAPPPEPVVSLLADDNGGALAISISNPAPTGEEPAAVYNDVEIDDGDGWVRKATMVAVNSIFTYWLPVAGRDYGGNVRVTAVAENGVTATTTTTTTTEPPASGYYGGSY